MYNTDIRRPKDDDTVLADDIFPLKKIILFVFFTVLALIFLPCALLSGNFEQTPVHFSVMAYVLLIGGGIYLMYVTHKTFFTVCMTLALFFAFSVTSSPVIPAVVISSIIIFAFGGFVVSVCKKNLRWVLILIPCVAYIGAYSMTGDPIISLAAVIVTPSIFAFGMLQRKNYDRKSIILVSTVLLLALTLAFSVLLLWHNNCLDFSLISDMISEIRNETISYLKELTVEIGGKSATVFDSEYIESYVINAFNMLPSIITVAVFIITFISHTVLIAIYKNSDFELMATQKSTSISVSIYAAVLFVASYILSLTTDVAGDPTLLSAVCGNLRIILTPALFIVGLSAVGVIIRKLRGFGFFFMLLLILAVFMLSSYIILIISAVGAFYIIIKSIDAWASKHYSKKAR